MYTRPHDYKLYCDTTTLTQVVNADLSLKRLCEYAVEDQIKSYLSQRFNFSKPYGEFTDTVVWDVTTIYKANNRVYLDATAYSASSTYDLDDLILKDGNVYICITAVEEVVTIVDDEEVTTIEAFTPAHWTLLGEQYDLFFVTPPEEAWDYQKNYLVGNEVYYKLIQHLFQASVKLLILYMDLTIGEQEQVML